MSKTRFHTLWIGSMILLLIFQYVRPQGIVPALGAIRPYMLMSGILLLFIFMGSKTFFQTSFLQMRLVWSILIFMVLLIPISLNKGRAFETTRNVMMFLPFMISFLILAKDIRVMKIILNAFIFMGLFNVIRGLLIFDGAQRNTMFNIGAFLTDPNDFSLYMNTVLPLAFFMFMHEVKWNLKKYIYLFATVMSVIGVIVSFSRGGMIGLVAVSLVMWWYSPNKKITTTLGVLGVVLVLLLSSASWKNSMGTATDVSNSTVQTRLVAWKGSFKMFLDYPQGVGPGNVPYHLNNYAYDGHHWFGTPNHSFWLTALAEGGIIGFLLVMTLVFLNVKGALMVSNIRPTSPEERYLKYYGLACLGSFVGFLSSGTFLTVNYYPHFWYLTVLIAAGVRMMYVVKQQPVTQPSIDLSKRRYVL